jgi:hypothetical protein
VKNLRKRGVDMNLGDVFMLNDNQIKGIHAEWGLERNREAQESVVPGGKYYIAEKRDGYFVIGRIFNENGFEVFGQRHSYLVDENAFYGIQTISKIRDEDVLIAKTLENMIEKGKMI